MKPLALLLLALTGCATVAGSLETGPPPQATGLDGELVRLATPTTVYLDCNLSGHDRDVVRAAAEYWNQATGLQLLSVETECDVPDSAYENLDQSMVVVRYFDKVQHDPRPGHYKYLELAATHLDTDRGLIYHASVNIYESWREKAPGMKAVSVLRHEFGHVLGLDHTTDPRCLMYFSSQFDDQNYSTPACGAEVRVLQQMYGPKP